MEDIRIIKKDKTKDVLVIEIPLTKERHNPYTDKNSEKMDNIAGMIVEHKTDGNDWDEIGFAYTIDMAYKGKDDQYTDIFFEWLGEKEEFEKICKRLKISIVYSYI